MIFMRSASAEHDKLYMKIASTTEQNVVILQFQLGTQKKRIVTLKGIVFVFFYWDCVRHLLYAQSMSNI